LPRGRDKEVPLRINGNFDLTGWLAILLLFVLAQVFLEGRACARSGGHGLMAILVKLDDLLHDRRMTLTELARHRHHAREPVDPEDRQGAAIRFSTLEAICEALACQPATSWSFDTIPRRRAPAVSLDEIGDLK